jgi:hypothetical protein
MGLEGLALSRLCYGSVGLLVYLPLLGKLNARRTAKDSVLPLAIAYKVPGEAKL